MRNPEKIGLNRLEKNPADFLKNVRPHHRIEKVNDGKTTYISDRQSAPSGYTVIESIKEGELVNFGSDITAIHDHNGRSGFGTSLYDKEQGGYVGGTLPVSDVVFLK